MSSKIYVGGLPYATTDAQLQEILMRRTPCSPPKHPQKVISAVAALRRYRLEIEISTQIGTHPLDYAP